jgi:hypothetical protein
MFIDPQSETPTDHPAKNNQLAFAISRGRQRENQVVCSAFAGTQATLNTARRDVESPIY